MQPASGASPQVAISFMRSVTSLLSLIEEENALLQRHDLARHATFTERKNQALRELIAVQRAHPGIAGSAGCEAILTRLRSGLAGNARLLQSHIAAVGEVSDIIIAAMREADSDGTYSRMENRVRR